MMLRILINMLLLKWTRKKCDELFLRIKPKKAFFIVIPILFSSSHPDKFSFILVKRKFQLQIWKWTAIFLWSWSVTITSMDIVDLEKNVGKDTTKKGFVTKPVMTTSVWSPLQRKKKRTSVSRNKWEDWDFRNTWKTKKRIRKVFWNVRIWMLQWKNSLMKRTCYSTVPIVNIKLLLGRVWRFIKQGSTTRNVMNVIKTFHQTPRQTTFVGVTLRFMKWKLQIRIENKRLKCYLISSKKPPNQNEDNKSTMLLLHSTAQTCPSRTTLTCWLRRMWQMTSPPLAHIWVDKVMDWVGLEKIVLDNCLK